MKKQTSEPEMRLKAFNGSAFHIQLLLHSLYQVLYTQTETLGSVYDTACWRVFSACFRGGGLHTTQVNVFWVVCVQTAATCQLIISSLDPVSVGFKVQQNPSWTFPLSNATPCMRRCSWVCSAKDTGSVMWSGRRWRTRRRRCAFWGAS